jgi:hypothetical protein
MPSQDLFAAPFAWLVHAAAQQGGTLGGNLVFLLTFVLAVVALGPAAGLVERLGRIGVVASGVIALGLLAWIVRYPAREPLDLLSRFDHLLFVLTAGQALTQLPLPWRLGGLALLSFALLLAHIGPLAVGVAFGSSLLGFVLLQVGRRWSDALTAVVQGAVVLGGYAVCWVIRAENVLTALVVQGLVAFAALRHISLVVEVRRGRPATLADWACYQGFYLNAVGAIEVYDEFHDRNLAGPVRADVPGAQRRLAVGILGVASAMQVPIWPPTGVATPDTLALWAWCALSYLRGGLFLMSIWMMAEGAALLFGVTLRPNWPRTLLAENPAQLWRAWRATMTNWLIRYVYVPLGGRDRRTLSVLGAFGVSVVWHWAGVPFTTHAPTLMQLLPILCWGALNAAAIIGWTAWRRRMGPPSPAPARRALRIAGTFVLGTFTVTLLGFTVDTAPHFPAFMRRLTGLPPLREIAAAFGLVD